MVTMVRTIWLLRVRTVQLLDFLRNEWILLLDAREEMSGRLRKNCVNHLSKGGDPSLNEIIDEKSTYQASSTKDNEESRSRRRR